MHIRTRQSIATVNTNGQPTMAAALLHPMPFTAAVSMDKVAALCVGGCKEAELSFARRKQ
jgi:hypothetical protein